MEVFFDADKLHFAACLQLHSPDHGVGLWLSTDTGVSHCPLSYASFYGFYDIAKHLAVKQPEHVNPKDCRPLSPLVAALLAKHFQVAELLHKHGADVNVRGDDEWTLLHSASLEGLVDIVRWLLNHGADADAQEDDGWTALHLASWNEHFEIVQMLLEHNADIHAQNDMGEVALHMAACHPQFRPLISILQLLLDHGAEVNARDNEGSTPLHHSSFSEAKYSSPCRGSVEVTRLLLEHGASMDAENNRGETPFQVALKEGHHEMVEFLWGFGIEYP